jgi:hypothetical protein
MYSACAVHITFFDQGARSMNTKGLTFAKAGVAAAALSFMMMLGGCPTEADPPGPPALTGTVSISGEPKVTKVLTADITALDGTGTPSYVWNRAENATAAGTAISGATANTYTLVADDAGKFIKVTVSRSGYTGSKTSAAKGAILASDAADPTIGTITVSAAEASTYVGGTLQFTAAVTVTGSDDPFYKGVTWSISSSGHKAGTTIDETSGLLTVASDESTSSSLEIKATSTINSGKSGTTTISVTAVPTVDSVVINETGVSVAPGGTKIFTARVNGTNTPPQGVTWSLTGGTGTTAINATTGVLTVGANQALNSTLTVKATSTFNTGKSGTATVTVAVVKPSGTVKLAQGDDPNTFTLTLTGLTWDPDLSTDASFFGYGITMVGAVIANGAGGDNPAIQNFGNIEWATERTSDTKVTITLSQYTDSQQKKYWGAGTIEMIDLTESGYSNGGDVDPEDVWDYDWGSRIAKYTEEGKAYYDYLQSLLPNPWDEPPDNALNGVLTTASDSEQVSFNIPKAD